MALRYAAERCAVTLSTRQLIADLRGSSGTITGSRDVPATGVLQTAVE